jgi:uncharacterized beta-barrel protein YwiB (DUF1934 family)
MKTRDAEIVFISRICDPEQPRKLQKTTAVLQGRVGKSGSSLYLVFNAEVADVGPADYTIRVGGKEALILRKGASPMRQPLMIGQTMTGTYGTQIGHMETKATAEMIDIDTDASGDSGSVRLIYDLSIAGQLVGKMMLDYRYKIG